MNIIEIQDDLLRRIKLLEGDLIILRNVVNSQDTTISSLIRRLSVLEQKTILSEEQSSTG